MYRLAARFLAILFTATATIFLSAQDTGVSLRVLDSLRGDEVSIRSGPGIEYTEHLVSFGYLTLPVTGRNDFDPTHDCRQSWSLDRKMWLRVQFNEIEGWIWRCHRSIEITGEIGTLPVVEPAFAVFIRDAHYPEIEGPQGPQGDYVFSTVVRYVSAVMREAPGLDAAVIGRIPFNNPLFVMARTERAGWVQVAYAGQVGWVASHLLGLAHDWQELVPIVHEE